MSIKGIDVSKWQGQIDWAKVKADGIQFAMIRAGYGQNNIDPQFKRNAEQCAKVGMPFGVYWFSYALNVSDAEKEAAYCLAAVKPYKLEYPICFDFEYDSVEYAKKQGVNVTKTLASQIVKAFCNRIEKAGYFAMNYANLDYLKNYFTDEVNARYGLWLAAWNNKSDPPRDCYIWQYTNSGKVNGISGAVDLNRSYVDFPTFLREQKLNNLGNWYDSAMKWGVDNGIISNADGAEKTVTKAQVVTMLMKYHKKFGG